MMVTVVIKHTDRNPAVLFIFTIYLSIKLVWLADNAKVVQCMNVLIGIYTQHMYTIGIGYEISNNKFSKISKPKSRKSCTHWGDTKKIPPIFWLEILDLLAMYICRMATLDELRQIH